MVPEQDQPPGQPLKCRLQSVVLEWLDNRWVFTACGRSALNWGEPYMEKIHIDDAPDGPNWRFKHN